MAAVDVDPAAGNHTDPPQWRKALDAGNRVRMGRAMWKRQLSAKPSVGAAKSRAAEILEEVPDVLLGLPVGELLCACRGLAETRADLILEAAGVDKRDLLGALSERDRDRLIGALLVRSTHEAKLGTGHIRAVERTVA